MNSLDPDKKWVTRLSSAGLVYIHFGKEILAKILNTDLTDPTTSILYDKMYEEFVEEIDAIDNGVKQFDGEPRYYKSGHSFSAVSFCVMLTDFTVSS